MSIPTRVLVFGMAHEDGTILPEELLPVAAAWVNGNRPAIVGAALLPRLRDAGHAVRAFARDPSRVAPGVDVVALNDALAELATLDPRPSQVVELRFFGGFSVEETAETLGVSVRTVINDWNTARAWLHHTLATRGRL